MSNMPTYVELEQRVKELEKEALQYEQTKEALRKNEDRYRRITEAVTDYVFKVRIEDGHPVETIHGTGCVVVTGYTPEDFVLDPYLWILMVAGEDRAVVHEQARCVLLNQDTQSIEHRILRKDGVIRWVKNTLVPHYDQHGNLLSYDGIVRDIDERRKAQEDLKKAHDELELRVEERTEELVKTNEKLQHEIEERKRLEKVLMQKEKLKILGAIAAGLAHEIRNPLVSIGGFAQRLKKKIPNLHECDIIVSESQRLEKMLTRIGSYLEPIEIHPQQCSVNTIITDCYKLLPPETDRREITCRWELAPNMPEAYVDPEILSQIIINLIHNAMQIMNKGGTLLVNTFESEQDIHIEFKNQAIGLKMEDPESLFMPFTETGQSYGLPLCHRLLKDMEGLLSFVQEKDCIVLTITLPKIDQSPGEKRVQDKTALPLISNYAMSG